MCPKKSTSGSTRILVGCPVCHTPLATHTLELALDGHLSVWSPKSKRYEFRGDPTAESVMAMKASASSATTPRTSGSAPATARSASRSGKGGAGEIHPSERQ